MTWSGTKISGSPEGEVRMEWERMHAIIQSEIMTSMLSNKPPHEQAYEAARCAIIAIRSELGRTTKEVFKGKVVGK